MERNSRAVQIDVLGEIRARSFEEIRYAYCYRIDRPQPNHDIIRLHHVPRLRQREVAIWTAKREEEVDDERHLRGSKGGGSQYGSLQALNLTRRMRTTKRLPADYVA